MVCQSDQNLRIEDSDLFDYFTIHCCYNSTLRVKPRFKVSICGFITVATDAPDKLKMLWLFTCDDSSATNKTCIVVSASYIYKKVDKDDPWLINNHRKLERY